MGKSKRFNNIGSEDSYYKKANHKKSRKNIEKNKAFDPDNYDGYEDIIDNLDDDNDEDDTY